MKPHKLRPHGVTLIFVPSCVSHRPTGEADPVSPLAARHAAARPADNIQCMNAPTRNHTSTNTTGPHITARESDGRSWSCILQTFLRAVCKVGVYVEV